MDKKPYDPSDIERKLYQEWEDSGIFEPGDGSDSYSLAIPPPNVTGTLHMGHALNNTLQDILVRFHRMQGKSVLWQPGTDHAGIATQALVERKLEKENLDKNTLGREKFIEKVWEWKNQYGDIIINQLKKLGCSCDWSRNAFTMDENLSKSVIKVFVELHKKKLIYKAKKLVNWDTVLKTAISDLEVDQREMNSKIYYIRYPIENSSEFITIATTRPETMLGDTAIAVNPKDKRYKKYVGKTVAIPIVGRKIKIIKDNFGNNIQRKLIGIKISPLKGKIERQKYGPSQALYLAIKETYNTIAMTLSYIGKMITGKESTDQLGGPIKIAQISGKVAEHGLVPFLSIMAYISISLGLINLFPIPMLDGGHLMFYAFEKVLGRPLTQKTQEGFFRIGLFLLLSLMFFTTFNDLKDLGLF